ncbi:MAG: hypothetical protein ABEN55_11890, partial [Bradymonadaceae bacterium]
MDQRVDALRALTVGLAVFAAVALPSGCKTPDDGQPTETVEASSDGAEALSELLETDADSLISTVETLRDRSFETSPSWRAQKGPLEPETSETPDGDERALLGRL